MSALTAIDSGLDVTYLSATHAGDTAARAARARLVVSTLACELFGVPVPDHITDDEVIPRTPENEAAARWRAGMYAALGLNQPTPAPQPAPVVPPSLPPVQTYRRCDDGDLWRDEAACRDVDPELFHPVSDGDLPRINAAKAVCRRCPVADRCLTWALETGQAHGVAGGLTAEQRRALRRRAGADTTETTEVNA